MGVKIVGYSPGGLNKVVLRMHNYWTKEYRQEREDKMKMRELLGLE